MSREGEYKAEKGESKIRRKEERKRKKKR